MRSRVSGITQLFCFHSVHRSLALTDPLIGPLTLSQVLICHHKVAAKHLETDPLRDRPVRGRAVRGRAVLAPECEVLTRA